MNIDVMENFSNLPDEAYVNIDVVKSLWGGVSYSTIHRSVKSGLIPQSKKLTARTVGWNVGELKKSAKGSVGSRSVAYTLGKFFMCYINTEPLIFNCT